ncbi:hypothetical protein ANCDUO_18201 [Ancylostoma duodenale]|uniref:Serine carboxypeptidase n=1 Tax=Ancylostoma duodenale TaxID=51022 RepID=A0A0C2CPK5_9BILA|nr:hypothetical protein ANCDUO_18201 [Ancylostoma duodenale]
MVDAASRYLSQSHVRQALHVPDFVQPWDFCRVLVYNGDADTACSMFEAEWMIESFARINKMVVPSQRGPWMYGQQIAGYTKRFQTSNMTIDLMTVKGAGHFVPTDRPGPALQMISNFFAGHSNYNNPVPFDLTRQPLLAQYTWIQGVDPKNHPLRTSSDGSRKTMAKYAWNSPGTLAERDKTLDG